MAGWRGGFGQWPSGKQLLRIRLPCIAYEYQ